MQFIWYVTPILGIKLINNICFKQMIIKILFQKYIII